MVILTNVHTNFKGMVGIGAVAKTKQSSYGQTNSGGVNTAEEQESLIKPICNHGGEDCEQKQSDDEIPHNPDFLFIRYVSRIVLDILKKFWALSTAAVLAILLLYWLYGGFFAFFMLCFAASGVVYQASDWLLYHPDQPPHSRIYIASPQIVGLPFENHFIRTKDGVLINAVLVKQNGEYQSRAPTVLFLHGNAGNIGHRMMNLKGLYHLCGCNVFMVEYRGYGHSEGTPSEEGLYLDAQASLDFLLSLSEIDRKKIVVFGRSLGGAVAVDVASRPEYGPHIMAVLLENTFCSIPDVARVVFNTRIIKMLPVFCYKNKFNSKKKISRLRVPTLFISGLADSLLPPYMMQELYQTSSSALKRIARFESGTHNETWQCSGYYQTINLFLDDVLCSESRQGEVRNPSPFSTVQIPPDIV